MKGLFFILLFYVFGHNFVFAQDPQYSHLYAIPLQLGPSFAGSTGASRATINFRDQWTAVQQEYVTYSAMVDHYFYGTRSGAGLVLLSDRAGAGDLTSSTVKLQYAYSLNMTKNLSFRPGVQMSYVQRTIDYDKIVFGDQLEFDVNKPSSMEPSLYQKVNYMDFSASLLTIYKKYWFGFTYDHITKPNQSLLNESSEVPLRLIAYAGAKVSVKSKFNKKRTRENMYFMVHYNQQGTAKQAYLGSYWEHNETLLGVWYRGVPFLKSYETNVNTDALILMLGFKRGNFSFLYSYDFTISKLVSKTSGSQEVTITWNWKNAESEKNKKHRMNVVPCPMSDGPRYKYHTQNSM